MKTILSALFILFEGFTFAVFAQNLYYNKSYSIACHNCYVRNDGQMIEDAFQFTTAIEIDIWDNNILSGIFANGAGSIKMNGDWFVKHDPDTRGNLNCCGGTFRDCLNRINRWSTDNPSHSVITIFIDKKENWSEGEEPRKPFDLDQLILSIFPREQIFKPSDLSFQNQDLKTSLEHGFPTLESLKGKFIFVITDGTIQLNIPFISPHRTPLNEYLQAMKNDAICFVAPQISSEVEITQPDGFTIENSKNVVFYNLEYSKRILALKINTANCLSRVFKPPVETEEIYSELLNDKVNFIAFDNYQLFP